MLKLGVTGNIASGKTLVESILQKEGVITVDSDRIVHDLLDNDKRIINRVQELFKGEGIDINNEKGADLRKKIGKIVFKDKSRLKALEEILHPEVQRRIEKFFRENEDKKIIAAIVPLLFEAGLEDMFDYVILVTAENEIRFQRLIKDRNMSADDAKVRMASQISQEEKINKADFVIDNSGSIENTEKQVKEILCRI